jgi:hypothetical protein
MVPVRDVTQCFGLEWIRRIPSLASQVLRCSVEVVALPIKLRTASFRFSKVYLQLQAYTESYRRIIFRWFLFFFIMMKFDCCDERMYQFKNAFLNSILYVNDIDSSLQTER